MKPKLGWLLLAWMMFIPPACATEPVEQFLSALRGQAYHDEALLYIETLRAKPSLAEDVRRRLGYEEAATLLATISSPATGPKARATGLERARELLEKFCAESPDDPLVGSAKNQLATILVERGRTELTAGGDAAVKQARKLFDQAGKQFAEADKRLSAELAKMPKLLAADDTAGRDRKQQLSSAVAEARLMGASVDYDLARTYEPKSKEAKKHYEAAAKKYGELYQAYRTRSAGLLARLWEGRCYQELGQATQALGCYGELMNLPIAPETQELRSKSTRQAMECWLLPEVKKYEAAIQRGERFEKESGKTAPEADLLAIRYLTAVAYQEQAQTLAPQDPNRKRLTGAARDYAGPVAERPGEFQKPAKLLLVALAGERKTSAQDPPQKKVKNFADAVEQARTALEAMQQATNEEAAARAKNDAAAAEQAHQQQIAAAEKAQGLLQQALSLRTKDTPADALQMARYLLCYVSFELGNYYEAAVLGEYLADHAPDTVPGRHGAKIAMAAWVNLYEQSKDKDRSFEVAQIMRMAELTFKRWPNEQEAEDAALTLVNFAAMSGEFQRALEYLNKIPADSPRRGQAELRAGQALWASYLRDLRLPDDQRMSAEKRAELLKQAEDLLVSGVKRVEGSPQVSTTLASAVFSLAQIAMERDDPKKAIEWLENSKYGPLTLTRAGSAVASVNNFGIETYKLALRAYIGVTPQQLEKAEKVMGELEKLVQSSGNAAAAQNLTAIYVSLGRQLEEHLKELRKAGKSKESDAVSKAFEVFLDRVMQRNAGGSLSSLNWVAETFAALGAGYADENRLSPRAQGYYKKAATAYQQLLKLAEKDPKFADNPDALVALKLRLADALRGAGDYDHATLEITQVLRDKPTLLTAQVQGAETYQDRGQVDPTGYVKAIMGGSPGKDGRNLIWGWARLSKITMSNPKFASTFHQSRLAIAESRYQYAMTQKDEARRRKVLEAAVGDLRSTYGLTPELGGPETAARYDTLLKQVQKALGQPEAGIKAFQEAAQQSARNEQDK